MKTEIDRDLAKQITNCLAEKSEDKKRNFIFVPGADESALIIDKKPIGKGKLKDAQKQANNTAKSYKGVCFGADDQAGKRVVFVVKKADESLERKLRKAIKELAGLNSQVEVRELGGDQDPEEVSDKTPDTIREKPKPTQAQKDMANKARYKKLVENINNNLALWQQYGTDQKAIKEMEGKVLPLLEKAEQIVSLSLPEDQRQYKMALEIAMKIDKHVGAPRFPEGQEPNVKDTLYGKYYAKRQELSAELRRLEAMAPNSGIYREALELYREAGRLSHVARTRHAIETLERVQQLLPTLFTRMKMTADLQHHVAQLTDPEVGPVELSGFEEEIEQAMNTPLQDQGAALAKVDEHMREAMANRTRYIEATKAARAALEKARGVLGNDAIQRLEVNLRQAENWMGLGGFNAGYDAMTDLEAKIQREIRMKDMPQQGVTQTDEVRRTKFELDMKNLNGTLKALVKAKAPRAQQFSVLLTKLEETAEKSLDQAETMLKEVSTVMSKDLELLKKPVRRRRNNWRRDFQVEVHQPEQYQTLENWKEGIKRDNVLTKVEVGKQLGEAGGFGKVNLLEPTGDDNVPPLVIKTPVNGATIEDMEDEAQLYGKVGDHPNLLKCFGVQEVDGTKGLVMECVQKGKDMNDFTHSLNEKLSQGKITQSEYWGTIQYTIRKSLEAISFLNEKGCVHNDIKPQNIMVDGVTGELKVIDLGTLNQIGTKETKVDNPRFKAPELAKGNLSTPQTDAFGVGATAYASINEEKHFHFGSNTDFDSLQFVYESQNIVEAFGELDTDEGAMQHDPNDPNAKDDPKKTVLKTGYSDFMNQLLHPDPLKRLSPKQALEHPFLSQSMLNDDEVKNFIKKMNQAPIDD